MMRFSGRQLLALMVIFGLSLAGYLAIGRSTGDLILRQYAPAESAQFQLIHTLNGISTQRPIVLGENLYVIGTQAVGEDEVLMALDPGIGAVRWQVSAESLTQPADWPADWQWDWPFDWQWGAVAAGEGVVWVADAFFLETTVTAYEAQTGQPLWHTPLGLLNGGDVDDLTLQDDTLTAHIHDDPYFHAFYTLDPQTGWLEQEITEEAAHIFMVDADTSRRYEVLSDTVHVSQYAGWEVSFEGCNANAQVQHTAIVVRTEVCETGAYRVFALNRENGVLLWSFDGYLVSNVAVTDSAVYFLTVENQLTAVSLTTGQPLGSLQFSPNLPAQAEHPPYFLAANATDNVAVYFGDSQQLFIFHFEPAQALTQSIK